MRRPLHLASIPSALLLLLAAAPLWSAATADFDIADAAALPTSPAQRHALHRRHVEIELRLAQDVPVAVRKMSEDPSEKFFPEFWQFETDESRSRLYTWPGDARDENHAAPRHTRRPARDAEYSNASVVSNFLPPILPHSFDSSASFFDPRDLSRNLFAKRAYQCPAGYHSCASIGFENSCCSTDETCQIIRNTGIGVVGCCPAGADCSGSVSHCDTAAGYRSCPYRLNKNGCCSPGFKCDNIGCVQTLSGATVGSTRTSTVVAVSTTVVTPSQTTIYITKTYPTGTRTLGPVIVTQAGPPVRPTEVTSIVSTETLSAGLCPTGYYRCSAYYLGGCCQVGRDCHSTHCPARASTDATANGVVTVIVETGVGVTTISQGTFSVVTESTQVSVSAETSVAAAENRGPCALGWSKCGLDGGGGCCPNGYSCGASCIATLNGLPSKVPKAATMNQASSLERWAPMAVALAGAVGLGMIWL